MAETIGIGRFQKLNNNKHPSLPTDETVLLYELQDGTRWLSSKSGSIQIANMNDVNAKANLVGITSISIDVSTPQAGYNYYLGQNVHGEIWGGKYVFTHCTGEITIAYEDYFYNPDNLKVQIVNSPNLKVNYTFEPSQWGYVYRDGKASYKPALIGDRLNEQSGSFVELFQIQQNLVKSGIYMRFGIDTEESGLSMPDNEFYVPVMELTRLTLPNYDGIYSLFIYCIEGYMIADHFSISAPPKPTTFRNVEIFKYL